MWLSFIAAFVMSFCVLFVPGYVALYRVYKHRLKAAALAPLVSFAIISLVGEVLALVLPAEHVVFGVRFHVAPYGILALSLLVAWALGLGLKRLMGRELDAADQHSNISPLTVVLYSAAGLVGLWVCFVSVISTPEHFAQSVDMVHHIGSIRAFMVSDTYTSLRQGLYMAPWDMAINPWNRLSFYPSAWNCMVALIASFGWWSVPVAMNACNSALIAIAFPASVMALLDEITQSKRLLMAGALFVGCFTIFPWGFLIYGPLYPNLCGYALMISEAAFLVALVKSGLSNRERLVNGALFFLGGIALALIHPNTIFCLAIFLMPFCIYKICSLFAGSSYKWVLRAAAIVALLVVWALFFVGMYYTPSVQKAAEFDWGVIVNPEWGFKNILRVCYVGNFYTCPAQYLPAFFIAAGVVYSCVNRRYLWLSASYILMCVALYINATQSGDFKHFLGAFWYTDPYRFGAMASIFAIFVCAVGFEGAARVVDCLAHRIKRPQASTGALAVLVLLIVWINYAPIHGNVFDRELSLGGTLEYPLGAIRERIGFDIENYQVYTDAQRAFVAKVQKIIPEDALVINVPADGSKFAFGTDGIRLYYRPLGGYGSESEHQDSRNIRARLFDYTKSQAIQDAVQKIGAQYVLQLAPARDAETGKENFPYFAGIADIDEHTPGFKLILQDGDFKLYKIEPLAR